MNTIETIQSRRSIRKFQNKPVPQEAIEKLLEITMQAPSAKNRQPWGFVVLEGEKKKELVETMTKVVHILKEQNINTGSCEHSIRYIDEAPVLILIFNRLSKRWENHDGLERYLWLADLQSIGGAFQTMLLAAEEMGLGTLWICDVFYADDELCAKLKKEEELIGAVAIGYPDEKPAARPRLNWQEVTEWIKYINPDKDFTLP